MTNMQDPLSNRPEGLSPEEVGANAPIEMIAKYASKTSAQILSAQDFEILKEQDSLYVVGVIGFSGQWGQGKIEADPQIKANVEAATKVLEEKLIDLRKVHGDSLIISSGATMEGVPKIIYVLCEKHGITSMGVACEKAFDYPLGK